MNIKELLSDLDPVIIIEFKNYLLENVPQRILILKLFLNLEQKKSVVINVDAFYIKMVFKNTYVVVVK